MSNTRLLDDAAEDFRLFIGQDLANLVLIQERTIDPLDVDAAVLHSLGRVGDLQQFAGSSFPVSIGAWLNELHATLG